MCKVLRSKWCLYNVILHNYTCSHVHVTTCTCVITTIHVLYYGAEQVGIYTYRLCAINRFLLFFKKGCSNIRICLSSITGSPNSLPTCTNNNGQQQTTMDNNRQQQTTMDNNKQQWTTTDNNGQQQTTIEKTISYMMYINKTLT